MKMVQIKGKLTLINMYIAKKKRKKKRRSKSKGIILSSIL